MLQITDVNFKGKKALVRVDINVPIKDGKVTNDARIRAILPTINYILEKGGKVALISHLGRPTEGGFDEKYSLKPVSDYLENLLGKKIQFVSEYLSGFDQTENIAVLENSRFNVGEKSNDSELGKKLANLADVYVMDAFAASHRAHASTYSAIVESEVACAGFVLGGELKALHKALGKPVKPLVAIVGGAKVSTKLPVLEFLVDKIDNLIIGGGIANTFLAAKGYNVGKSLCEHDLIDVAKKIMEKTSVPLPIDVVVAKEFSKDADAVIKYVDNVADDEMILDAGPETVKLYADIIEKSGTVVMNGPLGVFEMEIFANGTKGLLDAIAKSKSYSIAGGGDTVAAVEQFDKQDGIDYISTGGGAFLEYLEGKVLPSLEALSK